MTPQEKAARGIVPPRVPNRRRVNTGPNKYQERVLLFLVLVAVVLIVMGVK